MQESWGRLEGALWADGGATSFERACLLTGETAGTAFRVQPHLAPATRAHAHARPEPRFPRDQAG